MTRPAAFAFLFAGLVAVSADAQPQPQAPLTQQQQEALNKALGQLAGFDNLLEQFKQNPALLEQLKQNPELMKRFAEQSKKMGNGPGGDSFKPPQKFQPPTPKDLGPVPQPSPDIPPQPMSEPFNPKQSLKLPQDLSKGIDISWMTKGKSRGGDVPLGQDPRLANNPGLAKLIQMWEQKIGPLDQNPKLKSAVVDMLKGAGELKADGSAGGGDGFFSKLETDGGEVSSFAKWLETTSNAPAWKMPDVDLGKMAPSATNVGGGNWSFGSPGVPSAPSAPSFGGVSLPGGEAGLILLPLLLAVAAYLAWRFWPQLAMGRRDNNPLSAARNRWPVDPAAVNSRAELVKAFEYISLTLCGDAARVWHHRTIAAALRARVPTADPVADELADLYERARYTPPDEELSPSDLASARRCLSVLAGVTAA